MYRKFEDIKLKYTRVIAMNSARINQLELRVEKLIEEKIK